MMEELWVIVKVDFDEEDVDEGCEGVIEIIASLLFVILLLLLVSTLFFPIFLSFSFSTKPISTVSSWACST